MVISCVAYNCNNIADKRSDKSFHSFPFNRPGILREWVRFLRWDNWKPSKYSKLCSDHFVSTDFKNSITITGSSNGRRLLKEDAVPSIFNILAHLNKETPPRRSLKCSLADTILAEPNTSEEILAKIIASGGTSDATTLPIKFENTEKILLSKKVKVLQQKIRRRNKKIKSVTELIDQLKKNGSSSDNLNTVMERYFKGFALEFVIHQHENKQSTTKKTIQPNHERICTNIVLLFTEGL